MAADKGRVVMGCKNGAVVAVSGNELAVECVAWASVHRSVTEIAIRNSQVWAAFKGGLVVYDKNLKELFRHSWPEAGKFAF